MNKCSKCGAELRTSAKFCKSCGRNRTLNDKKARVMGRKKTWVKPAVGAVVLIAAVAGFWIFTESRAGGRMGDSASYTPQRESAGRLADATRAAAESGVVQIPFRTVDDGRAHFFVYEAAGKTLSFFVVKAPDGSFRTAFDACTACNFAKLGYRHEGNAVVCNNCGIGFSPSDIGRKTGGCNPIPLKGTIDGQMIVLKAEDIEAGAQYF